MKVLALNCGSSSLKFRLVGVPQEGGDQAVLSMVIGGEVKGIGGRSSLRLTIGDAAPQQTKGAVMHHQQAVQWAFEQLAGQTIDAVGHRVVHGGESFVESVRIDTHVHQHAGTVPGVCCMSWITTRNDGDTTIEASSRIVQIHNLPILFGR